MPVTPETKTYILESISALRQKLLDLTARNPLLSFKHSGRAMQHVRVIDELPNQLFEKLSADSPMSFRSLGNEESIPEDEKSLAFQRALDAAKLNDPQYLAAIRDLPDEAGDKIRQRLEQELRERLREQLGMPPRRKKVTLTVEEAAIRQGLDPSFDLPLDTHRTPEDRQSKHKDTFIQTLLFANALDRVLFNVREKARLSIEESGVTTLFCVFGFLEWYEDVNSEIPLHAPLLLMPLEIQRELVRGSYQYQVRGVGDGASPNIALAERLKRDFDLTLPPLDDEDTPETYFPKVKLMIAGQKNWKVRRWVTVGLFSFARIAMYNDLNPAQWSASGGIENHPKLLRLLAGVSDKPSPASGSGSTPKQVSRKEEVPLIADADSSQLEAIQAVLDGQDLVIDGPPGTGKSQTITNLIAATLARGKTVLFIAEKMAALSVVRNRLADAGLDDFCLELHSTKAGRKETIDKLAKRVGRSQPQTLDSELQATLTHLDRLRQHLHDGVVELAKPAGQLPCTVQQLLWRCQKAYLETQAVSNDIDEIAINDALKLTETDLSRKLALVARFEETRLRINAISGSPRFHPWDGLAHANLNPIACEDIIRRVRRLQKAASALQEIATAIHEATGCECPSASALNAFPSGIDLPKPSEPAAALTPKLANPSNFSPLQQWATLHSEYTTLQQRLREAFTDALAAEKCSPLQLRTLAQLAESSGHQEATLQSLTTDLKRRKREVEAWSSVATLLQDAATTAGWTEPTTLSTERLLLTAIDLAAEADATLLAARRPGTTTLGLGASVTSRVRLAERLRARREDLQTKYVLEQRPDPGHLRQAAATLRSGSWFSFLIPSWRRARKSYLGLSRSPNQVGPHEMAKSLDEIASYMAETAEFERDAQLSELLGPMFRGLDSDLEPLRRVAVWADQVRSRLPGIAPEDARLRALLLEGPSDQVTALASLASHSQFPSLKKVCAADTSLKVSVREQAQRLEAKFQTQLELEKLANECQLAPNQPLVTGSQLAQQLERLRELVSPIEDDAHARAVLGEAFQGTRTECLALRQALDYVARISASSLPPPAKNWLLAADVRERHEQFAEFTRQIKAGVEEFDNAGKELKKASGVRWQDWLKAAAPQEVVLSGLVAHTERCASDPDGLQLLIDDARLVNDVKEAGLGPVIDWFEKGDAAGATLAAICRRIIYRSIARDLIMASPVLAQFTGDRHEGSRKQFQELDRKLLKLRQAKIAADLQARKIDEGVESGPKKTWTNLALINNEIAKQKQHVPIRALLDRAFTAIQQLMPCFMMSPLSVAQYLKPGAAKFDLVVMDEASQLRPEDALGAIARGSQVVVVGDPMQLPPTSFFMGGEWSGDEEQETVAQDKSILESAAAVLHPLHRLKWHYRSRHASLIAFSNREFYKNELVVFPTPQAEHRDFGIEYHYVPEAVYGEGVNPIEGRAVAECVIQQALRHPGRSLGVVTLNQKQSEFVKLEIDRLAAETPAFEAWRRQKEGTLEPFFVKNLENVQGDERDTIIIATVYGKDQNRNFYQRFGPINMDGGHRRLNVLFTRAKCQILVYSSMDPGDIVADENSSWGVRALKGFLQYAKNRQTELSLITGREPDSEFEVSVAKSLREAGHEVRAQIGVVGYFIDLAVPNPKKPGEFLLGIECDGASYHSGKSVRDRDRLRQEILERLGWRIHRIWSLDWFRNPKRETDKVLKALKEAQMLAS